MNGVTVAVIAVGGAAHLRRCLGRLAPQVMGKPVLVVVPVDNTVEGVDDLRREFPGVEFRDLGVVAINAAPGTVAAQHELFDRRISAVFGEARGSHVALLQDWGAPAADWCDRMLEATRLPYAAAGGAVDNAGTGPLNWAVYFLDFGRHQPPLEEGPSRFLSDVNVVYRRDDLELVRAVWERRYNEVLTNWALFKAGKTLWRKPDMLVLHDRGRLRWGTLLAERLSWGRLFGAARAHELGFPRILPYILLSPLIPLVIVTRVARKVLGGGRNRLRFLAALPAFVLLAGVWSLGELLGYVTGSPAPAGEEA
jgi:hypothetical protein